MDPFQFHAISISARLVLLGTLPKDGQIALAAQLEHAMRAAWHQSFKDLAEALAALPTDVVIGCPRYREYAALNQVYARRQERDVLGNARMAWIGDLLQVIADRMCRQTTDPGWIEAFLDEMEGRSNV